MIRTLNYKPSRPLLSNPHASNAARRLTSTRVGLLPNQQPVSEMLLNSYPAPAAVFSLEMAVLSLDAALVTMVSTRLFNVEVQAYLLLICTPLSPPVRISLISLTALVLAGRSMHGILICKQPPSHSECMPLLTVHHGVKRS